MRNILLSFVVLALGTSAIAQWCIECTVLPPCGSGVPTGKETFCGSYDNASPQGCWSYYKRLMICPNNPEDPVTWGNSYRTEWRIGYTCIAGSDCY